MTERVKILFKKMSETAQLPKKPEFGNVGWDLYSDEDVTLIPGTVNGRLLS